MKTSIYLPDDLAEQIRTHGISISEVCQPALREAVQAAITREKTMTDLDAVAERLRGTITDEDKQRYQEGADDGTRWAREYATASELAHMATYDGSGGDFEEDHSLVRFVADKDGAFSYLSVRVDLEDSYWTGFIAGASDVWEAVQPLL